MASTVTERKVLLDGEWVENGEWLDVTSPYDGSPIARVAKVGAAETRAAIDAAERAMQTPLPAHERAEILSRVADALATRADEAARLICAEAGKPMKAARVEASRAVSTYTMAAVEARKLAGEVVPMDASQAGEGKLAFTQRVPIGVVGAISPFNFPLNLVAHKIAPARSCSSRRRRRRSPRSSSRSSSRRPAFRQGGSTSSSGRPPRSGTSSSRIRASR
jgi:acyl-CoA reductase-like NAD-dependent aldehyde dehydrogenase